MSLGQRFQAKYHQLLYGDPDQQAKLKGSSGDTKNAADATGPKKADGGQRMLDQLIEKERREKEEVEQKKDAEKK